MELVYADILNISKFRMPHNLWLNIAIARISSKEICIIGKILFCNLFSNLGIECCESACEKNSSSQYLLTWKWNKNCLKFLIFQGSSWKRRNNHPKKASLLKESPRKTSSRPNKLTRKRRRSAWLNPFQPKRTQRKNLITLPTINWSVRRTAARSCQPKNSRKYCRSIMIPGKIESTSTLRGRMFLKNAFVWNRRASAFVGTHLRLMNGGILSNWRWSAAFPGVFARGFAIYITRAAGSCSASASTTLSIITQRAPPINAPNALVPALKRLLRASAADCGHSMIR